VAQAGTLEHWAGLSGSGIALAIGALAESTTRPLVIITADAHHAHEVEQDIALLSPELPRLPFPDWDTLPYDLFSPNTALISRRLAALARIPNWKRGILIVPVPALMHRIAPRGFVVGNSFDLRIGDSISLQAMRERLDIAGYQCVDQVLEPGEFSVRGALLDLYPMGSPQPYRIELFDNSIETLRVFDPDSQRSTGKIDAVRLMPAREFPFDEAAARSFRRAFRNRFDVDTQRVRIYQDARKGIAGAGIESYLPLFFDATESLFHYLDEHAVFLSLPNVIESVQSTWVQCGARYEQRRHDVEHPLLTPDELYLNPEQIAHRLSLHSHIQLHAGKKRRAHRFDVSEPPDLTLHEPGQAACAALKRFLNNTSERVLIAADSPGRREVLLETLAASGIKPEAVINWRTFADSAIPLAITTAALSNGFRIADPALCVLTEGQLFPDRVPPARLHAVRRDPNALIRDLAELRFGAPVVHEDHGVGRYLGLETLAVGDDPAEFITIAYADDDKLYVPVAQMDLVSRYTGSAPDTAPLHRLGSRQWEKAKRKAAQKARDVAAELLDVYSRREAAKGVGLDIDDALYQQFAAEFPFSETPDQARAISDVLEDLRHARHADRVVCGDVGFGKTEVALRAAFVAAQGERQVAVLVPTTLLAQQHFQNFSDRLADWPVNVDVLSRFRSKKENLAVLERLAAGSIDIIIGTHRLLQDDVRFHDLGLVIIDEEQRFGVRQKERFKQLRAEVNILTLTATPIPRTLNMAMSGLRELSLIATPPAQRLAVRTFVGSWDNALLQEACQREIQRGGQVYLLHNEVRNIEAVARAVSDLLPEARVRFAHGQMREKELERVMLDFHRQRFNILVCTTIIESGIDIPNANTIIIDRADKFGLAQLHQLRGRVGRSNQRAYCYLLLPDPSLITADAKKRIDAITSMEELGAGFTLATHDLEIRGAGELLGEEQSGQINEVVFSLYTELLSRAVASLRNGDSPDIESLQASRARMAAVELHSPALIPDTYLADIHLRLTFYKRIAAAKDSRALRDLQVEMIDRFGLLPPQLKQLFAVTALRQRATKLGIRKLDVGPDGGSVHFCAKANIDPMAVISLVQSRPDIYRFEGQDKLRVSLQLPGAEERLDQTSKLLDELSHSKAA